MWTIIILIFVIIYVIKQFRYALYVHPTTHSESNLPNSLWIGQIHVVCSRPLIDLSNASAGIIHFHGNAGCVSHRASYVFEMDASNQEGIYQNMHIPTFIFDYRGFGCSPTPKGGITPETMCEDGIAVAAHLCRAYPNIKHWIYYGESIGTSVASYVASQLPPVALFLQSPFYNIASLVADIVGFPGIETIVSLIVGSDFNTAEYLENYKGPVIIAHSPADEIIPFINARRLGMHSHLYNPHTQFIEIRGCHNTPIFPEEFLKLLATAATVAVNN